MRAKKAQNKHDAKVKNIARGYRAQGYRVAADVPRLTLLIWRSLISRVSGSLEVLFEGRVSRPCSVILRLLWVFYGLCTGHSPVRNK
jgi:hypothetical protein